MLCCIRSDGYLRDSPPRNALNALPVAMIAGWRSKRLVTEVVATAAVITLNLPLAAIGFLVAHSTPR
jgi:hypothetical protein